MPLKPKRKVEKLVLVLETSTPVTTTREEAIETIETVETGEDGKNDEYSGNFARVLYIRYPITIKRKSVLELFDSNSKVNAIHLIFT